MSSSKKKSVVTQCTGCSAYFLVRDLEKHVRPISALESSPVSTKQVKKTVVRKSAERNVAIPSVAKVAPKCEPTNYLESRLQTIEPGRGMAVFTHHLPKRDDHAPTDLHGWERYNFALVHPETLNQFEAFPRCLALVHLSRNDESLAETFDLVTLWPSPEIPQMRVNFPPRLQQLLHDKIIQISLVNKGPFLDRISVKLTNMSDDPKLFVKAAEALPKFSRFPLYLRSYFANAFVSPELSLRVQHYSYTLQLRIEEFKKLDSESGGEEGSEDIADKLEQLLKIKDKDQPSQIHSNIRKVPQLPQVFRVHPDVVFTLLWDEPEEGEVCLR